MLPEIIATVVAVLLLAIGCIGIVVPVLPGSITVVIGLVIWAVVVRAPEGWVALALGVPLAIAGMSASMVLTGTRLRRRQIPNRSLLYGVVGAVIGLFVIPVLGLFIGFAVGLLLSETYRQRDLRAALESSWVAIKAMGIGIAIELACALLASSVFVICGITYFVTA
ncbi:DUF456 domain-containing protein [Kocuria palustris]|uniref:DUF456 domain-containing protein n=1 Tax=Kocuria palustris TaxID=71999 RepID=UPI0011A03239|nr:DUF456 domain-containing protein [Kocuria palustris]